MLIDMDTRKLKLKKGDLLIFDGKTLKPIALDEIVKPLQKDIAKLQKQQESRDLKIKRFIQAFKGGDK